MIIRTMHGSQSFRKTSAKIHLFAMDCNDTYDRAFLNVKGKTIGRYTKVQASADDRETNGLWFTQSIQVSEGFFVCISSSVSRRGIIYAEGVLLISMREDAPLISVDVDVLSPKTGARFSKISAFQGRGYILEVKELNDFNISYPRGMLSRFFDKEEIGELYTVRELRGGKPRPEMVSVPRGGGETKEVRLPRRKLRVIRVN